MNDFLLPIVIGIPFAALVGRYIARKSAAKEPIYGGSAAQIAHYLGATGASGGAIFLPFVPIMLILGRSVQWALVMGISSLVFGLLSLVVFAVIERRVLSDVQPLQERGWTEADARKSRL
jgi:hypothetical protein